MAEYDVGAVSDFPVDSSRLVLAGRLEIGIFNVHGELHALPGAPDPLDQNAVNWCYELDYLLGEDHTIERPEDYDFWREYQADFWPAKQLSWHDVYPHTLKPRFRSIFRSEDSDDGRDVGDFWHYRRIFYKGHYPEGRYASDITLVNWPQID